mmetsp:Transcript_410/g.712  ORF Transcript_410/g.712 Transcript_410/m.712 type:complete len:99 (-) Transcript_410:1894-2190(-)
MAQADELTEEQLQVLREALDSFYSQKDDSKVQVIFELIDRNGDGKLQGKELQVVLSQVIDQELTEADVNSMIEEADSNHDDVIDLGEFMTVMKKNRDS